ncbi:hypothetical protein BJ741DRAFT_664727 [Chytriomyces cf. hyalinus JEL632]|nr:hypothetical protein BJ741DRAFT_664727 [Chytriomyces cf. hyalinus JEL632]
MYQLYPLSLVTEINGQMVANLDGFLAAVSKIASDSFARIKTVTFQRYSRVTAIRTNSHYFEVV